LATANIDILLQDELNHLSLFVGNYLLRLITDYPIVSIVHHLRSSEQRTAWRKRLYRLTESIYLNSIDGVICNSSTTRREVETLSQPAYSIIASPGNDHINITGSFENQSTKYSRYRILFVGSVIPRKEVHTLVHAFKYLPASDARLDIVGSLEASPQYSDSIRRLIHSEGLADRVYLHGRVDEQLLHELYASCDVFAAPSSYEGFGIVYLEAMKYGKPVIAGKKGGQTDFIEEPKNGYFVHPGDIHQLSDRLNQLYERPKLRTQMGEESRRLADSHPTWMESMSDVRAFMQTLVDSTP
jgi:glycosyltransferase involved in cell wall biosynthesis